MATPAVKLARELVGHLHYLERTRAKMEALLAKDVIVRRDIEQVYAGLYLEAITSLEQFIEDLFIGLLVGRIDHVSLGIVPRVSFKSDIVARDVVHGGRQYVDWFPYHLTEERSKAFFRNGLPFTRLESSDKEQIIYFLSIRHAIAHKSRYSQRRFEQRVLGTLPLMPRERTPAGFLRSVFRIAPIQTRYENLVGQMATLALKLCA